VLLYVGVVVVVVVCFLISLLFFRMSLLNLLRYF